MKTQWPWLAVAASAAIIGLVGCTAGGSAVTGPDGGRRGHEPRVVQPLLDQIAEEVQRYATNERGNVVRTVGERIEVWDTNPSRALTEPVMHITINSITRDAQCLAEDYGGVAGRKPENGQFLAVRMTVETSPDYNGSFWSADPTYGWELVTPDSRSHEVRTAPTYTCGDTTQLMVMRPARTYEGTIFLDVPRDLSGSVLVLNAFGDGGWEFAL